MTWGINNNSGVNQLRSDSICLTLGGGIMGTISMMRINNSSNRANFFTGYNSSNILKLYGDSIGAYYGEAMYGSDTIKAGTKTSAIYSYFKPGDAGLTSSSDSSLKTNITNYSSNIDNLSNVSPKQYKFKMQYFLHTFDENSVPNSVNMQVDDTTIIKVSNIAVKNQIRKDFYHQDSLNAIQQSNVWHVGFMAQDFGKQITGDSTAKEIDQSKVMMTMWLKLQQHQGVIGGQRKILDSLGINKQNALGFTPVNINDSRLSDARTPLTHTQAWSTITGTPTTRSGYGITDAAASTHSHPESDITNLTTDLTTINTNVSGKQATLTRATGAIVYSALSNGTLALAFGTNSTVKVTPTATGSFTTTVPAAGCEATLIVLTSGTVSYVMTFSTGFKSTGTLTTGTTTAKVFTVSFTSDGTNLIETGRTAAH